MTQEKTRRLTLHLSPERSKEIRADVANAGAPKAVQMSIIEEALTRAAELVDTKALVASILAAYYASRDIPLVLKPAPIDPDYNHEAAQPLTGEPEPEGMEGTA